MIRSIVSAVSLVLFFNSSEGVSKTVDAAPHTIHVVTTNKDAKCQLGLAFEDSFYFVDSAGNQVWSFDVTSQTPFEYGLVIDVTKATFNMEYTLTCVVNAYQMAQSPKVVFVVGANGPAQPNINTVNLYGASGIWKTSPGVGENFFLTFP